MSEVMSQSSMTSPLDRTVSIKVRQVGSVMLSWWSRRCARCACDEQKNKLYASRSMTSHNACSSASENVLPEARPFELGGYTALPSRSGKVISIEIKPYGTN